MCYAARVDMHTNFSVACAYYTGNIKVEYDSTVV